HNPGKKPPGSATWGRTRSRPVDRQQGTGGNYRPLMTPQGADASTRISHTPRPCVAAAKIFKLGASFKSTTSTFGSPIWKADQCRPIAVGGYAPRSVPT